MPEITIEHNPGEDRLKELGVANWDIWEKEVSEFPIDFDETETAYILEGEILVTLEGGEPVRILPEGLNSHFESITATTKQAEKMAEYILLKLI